MIRRLLVLVVAGALVAACTQSKGLEVVEAAPTSPPETLVILGGAESDGDQVRDDLRDLWARRLFDELAISTTYVNLASSGASIADALSTQVPDAREVAPDTVLVWSMAADEARGTTSTDYRDDLLALVGSFDEDTDVVILDGPQTTYSEAVAEAVDTSGATAVDLTDLGGDPDADQEEIAERVLTTLEELDGGG